MKKAVATSPGGQVVESILLSHAGHEGLQVEILTYGATIHRILVPGGSASPPRDVTLGFDDAAGYFGDHPFFGSAVGRVANRIRNGSFELDGHTYKVSQNRPPHCLHGGFKGLSLCSPFALHSFFIHF